MKSVHACIFIPKSVTDETLAAVATQGKHLLEPFKSASGNPAIYLLEDSAVDNNFEVHRHEADLWICLGGEVEFEVGGELIEPWTRKRADGSEDTLELKAKPGNVCGGTKYTLRPGDILFIPAGVPHAHRTKGTARLYIIKIPQPVVPLEEIPGWRQMPYY